MAHALRAGRWLAPLAFVAAIAAVGFAFGEESADSGATKYWYDLLVSSPFEASGVREYIGASTLNEAEMARALTGSAAIAVTDRAPSMRKQKPGRNSRV